MGSKQFLDLVLYYNSESKQFVIRKDRRVVFFSPNWEKARKAFSKLNQVKA